MSPEPSRDAAQRQHSQKSTWEQELLAGCQDSFLLRAKLTDALGGQGSGRVVMTSRFCYGWKMSRRDPCVVRGAHAFRGDRRCPGMEEVPCLAATVCSAGSYCVGTGPQDLGDSQTSESEGEGAVSYSQCSLFTDFICVVHLLAEISDNPKTNT